MIVPVGRNLKLVLDSQRNQLVMKFAIAGLEIGRQVGQDIFAQVIALTQAGPDVAGEGVRHAG